MKKQFATLLIGFLSIWAPLLGLNLELNVSYDYFRGMPDGSWNGNNGVIFAANMGTCVWDCIGVQAGGSFGIYNWDGRGNLVFNNPKKLEQQTFATAGLFSSFGHFNAGLVYDHLFTKHFGIFDLNPSIDQLRFQGGYQFCSEEFGVWGTAHLHTSHKWALGVPISFKAINQINVFWTHFFENCAMTTLWIGAPYENSLRYSHKPAGVLIAGFSLRVPLTERLLVDGNGSYMRARRSHGVQQSKNYAANICIGITYLFGEACPNFGTTYMPLANHSNFLVDTNSN